MPLDVGLQPIAETSLSVYFKERLSDCAQRLKPPPQEDTCWYLGSLLDRFVRAEHLFSYDDDNGWGLRPLALLYGDALEARSDRERCLLLQQLGDMALFLGALFPERFSRRGIHQDYVIGMGGGAYDYLSSSAQVNRHIYAELAGMFSAMLELIASACSRTEALGERDILALYQRWLETGDPAAAARLRAHGIDPAPSSAVQ
ncbi:MAG: hypothetical protein V2J89_07295 [Halieaceae bacterium]|jgi:hypothetical protein|nr:hypothetical protein [Halieaceae bacterium]